MAVLDCALLSAVSAELVEAGAFSPPFGLSLSKSGGCLGTVRAEPVEAWACWFGRRAGVEGGGRVVAPAGDSLFFASPKKSKQKKGDPQSATPSLCEGANLRRVGCGVRRGTRFAAAQRRSDNHSESEHEAWALRRPCHPATTPPQAQPAGGWTAEQPHGPLLRSAPPRWRKCHALRRLGRATRWPEWMFAGFPSVRAEKRRAGGGCVCRRTHALRALNCRSCLNGARSAQ